MSDEQTPSRSYVLKQGGFTDPIVDAVMNLGRVVVSSKVVVNERSRVLMVGWFAGLFVGLRGCWDGWMDG